MSETKEITVEDIEKSAKMFRDVTQLLIGANELLRDVLEEGDISNELREAIINWKQRALIMSGNVKEDYGVS